MPYYWFCWGWSLGLSPGWLWWGWQEGSTSPHASSAGLNCPSQVSPLTFALEHIKNSLLRDQNQLPFPFLGKSIVFCLLCSLHYFIAILPTWPTPALTIPLHECSLLLVFNFPYGQIAAAWNFYLRPVAAAAQICCTASEGEQFQWAKIAPYLLAAQLLEHLEQCSCSWQAAAQAGIQHKIQPELHFLKKME